MGKLPDKLIKIDQVRIERGMGKICKCENKKFTLDTDNRRVTCSSCGAPFDPFEAMLEMAKKWDRINSDLERIFQQKKELDKYKPHLRIIKELERKTRTGPNQMYPLCPSCEEPFLLTELTRFYGAKFVTGRIVERIDRQKKAREEK